MQEVMASLNSAGTTAFSCVAAQNALTVDFVLNIYEVFDPEAVL